MPLRLRFILGTESETEKEKPTRGRERDLHRIDWIQSCRKEPLKLDVRNLRRYWQENSNEKQKKYKHKRSETNQKTGHGIPYSKPDSRPFLHFFLRTNYFTLIIGLNFSESVGWLLCEIGVKCIRVEKTQPWQLPCDNQRFF